MKKISIKNIIKNDYFKLSLIFFSILLLIMLSLIFLEDIGSKRFLMNAISLTLSIAGGTIGYITTNNDLFKYTKIGITRKEIYKLFIIKVLTVLVIIVIIEIYYILMYKLISKPNESLIELFNIKKILLIMLIFTFISFTGLIIGLLKLKKYIIYLLLILLITIAILLLVIDIAYWFLLILFIMAIGMILLSHYLVYNLDIQGEEIFDGKKF